MRLESVNLGLRFRLFLIASIFNRAAKVLLVALCLSGSIAPSFAQSAMQFLVLERCSSNTAVGGESAVKLDGNQCILIPKELGEGKVILASGAIEKLSADQFAEFTQTYPAGSIVILQSLGGDLIGGLRLGQAIRTRSFHTYLAAQTPFTEEKSLGKCFSACAYAFLGGLERQVDATAQYGVHQFRGNGKELDAIQTQKLSAILGRYIDSMGVNRQLLDDAMLTDPGKVRLINAQSRKAWRVENTALSSAAVLNKWRLEAAAGGKRLAFASQRQAKSAATLTLAFAQLDGQLRALLIVRPDPSLEGSNDWTKFFTDRVSLLVEVVNSNGEGGKRFQLSPVSNWMTAGSTNTPGTRQIWLATSSDLMQNLQASAQFSIKPLWQITPTGLDEKTLFGTTALKDALLAL